MNDEQFEGRMQIVEVEVSQLMANQLRARNTAQREALARVEAERDTAIVQMQNIRKQRDAINKKLGDAEFNLCIAHQQLAEAVGLIRETLDEMFFEEYPKLEDFLSRIAQAEQKEAKPATFYDAIKNPPRMAPTLAEAQGAQAVEFQREDRYIVIKRKDLEKAPFGDRVEFQDALDVLVEHLPKREYLVVESNWPEYEPTWAAIQARVEVRAALATQPSVQWRDGELPPVGTTCEVNYRESWHPCEIIAHFKQRSAWAAVFTVPFGDGAKSLDAFTADAFRPAVRGAEHDQ